MLRILASLNDDVPNIQKHKGQLFSGVKQYSRRQLDSEGHLHASLALFGKLQK